MTGGRNDIMKQAYRHFEKQAGFYSEIKSGRGAFLFTPYLNNPFVCTLPHTFARFSIATVALLHR